MSDIAEIIEFYVEHPEELGRQVGFKDLTPMHGEWIRQMIAEKGD